MIASENKIYSLSFLCDFMAKISQGSACAVRNIAAIDIGTNTLLMVVASVLSDGSVKVLRDEHSIARLGEGVQNTHVISESAVQRATEILKKYKNICDDLSVDKISVVSTSAMRDAQNSDEIICILASVIKSNVKIISGEKEAELSYRGALDKAMLSSVVQPIVVVDIGGGSTEVIAGRGSIIQSRVSMDIGAVRIFERFFHRAIPPLSADVLAARTFVREQLAEASKKVVRNALQDALLVGVGGTFTTLAAMNLHLQEFASEAVHLHSLSTASVHELTEMLLHAPLETLQANPAIHPQRADILPAGALILEEILSFYGLRACQVSTRGLRYGVLYELADSMQV